jgi:hypothetical protein
MPRVAGLDLFEIDVATAEYNLTAEAFVFIDFRGDDRHRLAVDQVGEV